MQKYKINIPIYGFRLTVIITDDFEKVATDNNIVGMDKYIDAFVFLDKISNPVLVIKDLDRHGVIAHEVIHVTNMIFEQIGHKLDLANDEPQVYLIGYITDEIYKLKNKYNEKDIRREKS